VLFYDDASFKLFSIIVLSMQSGSCENLFRKSALCELSTGKSMSTETLNGQDDEITIELQMYSTVLTDRLRKASANRPILVNGEGNHSEKKDTMPMTIVTMITLLRARRV